MQEGKTIWGGVHWMKEEEVTGGAEEEDMVGLLWVGLLV